MTKLLKQDIQNIIYFDKNKNTKVSSDNLFNTDYDNGETIYSDSYVKLVNPVIHYNELYNSFDEIPDVTFYNNQFYVRNNKQYSSTIDSNGYGAVDYYLYNFSSSSWGTTFYESYIYNFSITKYKTLLITHKEWNVTSSGVYTETLNETHTYEGNRQSGLFITGPTTSNSTWDTVEITETSNIIIIPTHYDIYDNVNSLYFGQELIYQNT